MYYVDHRICFTHLVFNGVRREPQKKCFQHIMMKLRCIGEDHKKNTLKLRTWFKWKFFTKSCRTKNNISEQEQFKRKEKPRKNSKPREKNHSLIFFVMKKIYHWTSTSCTRPGFTSFRQDISVANQLRPSCVHKSVRDINQLRAHLNLGDKLPYVRALVKGIFRRTSRHVF